MEELDHTETLDDISNAIKAARKKIDGLSGGPWLLDRESSVRTGLSIRDVSSHLDEEEPELPFHNVKDLLHSLQTLVEALFAQRKFLQYAPSLEACISNISDIDAEDVVHVRNLVDLLIDTVQNHNKDSCTELRYVTLLEIVNSYSAGWEPSKHLSHMWTKLDRAIDRGIKPRDFRRNAYGVLVSLPWVPSSYGLYAACSFADSEYFSDDLPIHVKSKLDRVRDKLLLRSELVHRILDSIHGQDVFTVVITYSYEDDAYHGVSNDAGVGKTTLAALLAAHPSLANDHLVLWVDVPPDRIGLTCQEYMECLETLCEQLSATPNWPDQVRRLEDLSLRKKREKEHMIRAKRGMSKILQRTEKNILLVLDGANHDKDVEKFKFLERQSTIVVTRSSFIPRVTHTMEIGEMSENEALQVFARESALDKAHILLRTVEAKTIVQQCRCHPLIVRTAARWFRLKQVTAGFAKGLEELNLELSMLKHNSVVKTDTSKILAEVMNVMLSPAKRQGGQPTKLLKLCVASAAVVFADGLVVLDAVHLLWSQILSNNPAAIAEFDEKPSPADISKRVWFVSESFIHLGLFAKEENDGRVLVRIYHQMYLNYALSLVHEVSGGSPLEETKSKWHGCFVAGYAAHQKAMSSIKGSKDQCNDYALLNLVTHMIDAKNIPKVVEMLRDDRYFRERLKKLGWVRGTKIHVDNCLLLQRRANESKSASPAEARKVVLSILKKVAGVLGEETPNLSDDNRVEKAKALHLVGFTQADNNSISEALTQYKLAYQLMTVPTHPFNAIIMYSQAVLHLARNDHDKGLKKIKGCLKVLKDNASQETSLSSLLQPELIQLRGDALAAACDYMGAEKCYEEAIDQMNPDSRLETGSALYRRGRLHQTMGELVQATSAFNESIHWKLDIGENDTNNLAAAYSSLGDIYLELQEDKKALQNFEKAFAIIDNRKDDSHEIDHHLLTGKLLFLRADDDGSNTEFEAARQLIMKTPKLLMNQSAYDLRCMARICMDRGERKRAIEILEDGLATTKGQLESLERGSILYELGHCLYNEKENKEAIVCFEESLKIRQAKLGDCEPVLDTLITIGKVYKAVGLDGDNLKVCRQVLQITEKIYSGNDDKTASALFGVGEALETLKLYGEAVATYSECKELLKRAFCGDHLDVAKVLTRLGKVHASHKGFGDAHDCYLEALKIRQANLEPDHPLLAETLYGIGVVAREREEYNNARHYLQDALRIQKQLELAHETCITLIELGDVFRSMHDPQSAIGCYERCISIITPDKSEPSLFGKVYLALGHAKLNNNQILEAMECYDHGKTATPTMIGRTSEFIPTVAVPFFSPEEPNRPLGKRSSSYCTSIPKHGDHEIHDEKLCRSSNISERLYSSNGDRENG